MSGRTVLLATALLAISPAADAFEPDCQGLGKIIAQADMQFTALRGQQRGHLASGASATPAQADLSRLLGEFDRQTWQGKLVMKGAADCEVARVHSADRDAVVDQVHYACAYPRHQVLPPALNRTLAACVGRPADPDADTSSLTIVLDRVESGEGHAITAVGATADVGEGLRVLVSRVTCQSRRPSGCDGKDEDE